MKFNKYSFVLFIVFILSVLLHETAEEPFEWFVREYSYESLNLSLNIFFFILFASLSFFMVKRIMNSYDRKFLIWSWCLLIILSFLSYKYLMPYKSEGMHFIQYGIMGVLSYFVFYDFLSKIVVPCFLGILDETYQFVNGNALYLDFNDMILNFLGGTLGILCIITILEKRDQTSSFHEEKKWIKNPIYLSVLCFSLAIILLLNFGFIGFFEESGKTLFLSHELSQNYSADFWFHIGWGSIWHRLRPVPGSILLSILPLVFYYMKINLSIVNKS